jgi:hypothetical protein
MMTPNDSNLSEDWSFHCSSATLGAISPANFTHPGWRGRFSVLAVAFDNRAEAA